MLHAWCTAHYMYVRIRSLKAPRQVTLFDSTKVKSLREGNLNTSILKLLRGFIGNAPLIKLKEVMYTGSSRAWGLWSFQALR